MNPPVPNRPAPPDTADRHVISTAGLDRTLFVEAGAGTGKTTELVRRITNLVLDHGVPLADIAAITFTEAAAAELQTRIRVQFEQRREQAGDLLMLERCAAALADSDRAAISTLHGFASRLLGEFAVAAGLPPRVHVLDEVASQLAAEERWQRFVDELYDEPANAELLTRARLVGIAVEPRYLGQPSLRDVAVRLNQNWDLLDAVASRPRCPLRPLDFTPFHTALDAVRAQVDTCADEEDKLYRRAVDELLPEASTIAELPAERRLQALSQVGERWAKNLHRGTRQNWPDVDVARQVMGGLARARQQIVSTVVDELLRHFLVIISRQVLHAAEARRRAGGLEFHDLLVLARAMLRTNDDARAALHRRYRHILLDEFQDTDPIQIELAVLVATDQTRPGGASWSDLAVPDGRLFFVGDPKQSIYRFRRADIGLFLRARRRFGGVEADAAGAGIARLRANFRTVAPVLDWVNAFFSRRMAEEISGAQPAYEALHPMRPPASGADHRPLLLGGAHPDPKVLAGTLRELEASDVARTVAAIVADPSAWPVQDRTTGEWRPARLSDVTILLPTRTSLPYLREALDAAAIPYRLATGTLVYDSQEVRDVLAVLRVIDDPSDELSLVAALRSPLYACSDVDLYRFRQAGGEWDIRRDPPAALPADNPVAAACAHLRELWRQRWWLGPSQLMDRVLRDRHAFLLAFGTPRPADVWRRLRFLADQARAFEDAGGAGLRAFVDWAALQGADGARVHEPLLPETDEDMARIMTIHGAKGLEFPITILSGMSTQVGRTPIGVSVLWNDDGTPELRLGKSLATDHHEPRADLELEMDLHEKLRLFYVACTRARDHLVISCHHKPASQPSYGQLVWESYADHDTELCRRPPVAGCEPEDGSAAQPGAGDGSAEQRPPDDGAAALAARETWLRERAELAGRFRESAVWSASTVVRKAVEATAAELDEPIDEPPEESEGSEPSPFRRPGRTGSAVGRAVHATLQLLDLRQPQHVAELARQQCAAEAIVELAGNVERLVQVALQSDAIRLAAAHPHHKELYVAAPVGRRVVEGYVDLLIETPDGLVVVDYKTDAVHDEAEIDARLEHYELQGAAYVAALEAVTGRSVVECRFVFLRPNGAVERRIRDLAGSRRRLLAVLGEESP